MFNFIINAYCNSRFILQLLQDRTQRKHLVRWISSQKRNYFFTTPSPWWVFDAIDYLTPRVFNGMNVFEFGSGGSTLFWLSHGANVVSVEHNSQFYTFMKNKLQSNKSIDYRLVMPELTNMNEHSFNPSDPEKYFSSEDALHNFYNYVTQIDAFPDEYFDLILIDGRARPSCIKHSVNKVKVGGIIVLDNSNRDYYFTMTEEFFGNFSKNEFFGVGPQNNVNWKTNIYIRMR